MAFLVQVRFTCSFAADSTACRPLRQPFRSVSGKTTLLRHLLENSSLKIGCIVNDVADVNIDAKLIRNDRTKSRKGQQNTTADLADTIELANGCACKCNTFQGSKHQAPFRAHNERVAREPRPSALLQAAAFRRSCLVLLKSCSP